MPHLTAARVGVAALAAVVILGATLVALLPPTDAPGSRVALATTEPGIGSAGPPPRSPTPAQRSDFWAELSGGGGTGPAYRSLRDIGETSTAVVVGSFTGDVEPGREACDEEAMADGAPREMACVFFANVPFRVDDVLAGSLPEQDRSSVRLEYPQDAVREVVPSDERVVMFIASRYLRRAGVEDVYYAVGTGEGTFRDVGGRIEPLALPDDPQFGRLEGMPFEQFVDLVRQVPILDRMPEG